MGGNTDGRSIYRLAAPLSRYTGSNSKRLLAPSNQYVDTIMWIGREVGQWVMTKPSILPLITERRPSFCVHILVDTEVGRFSLRGDERRVECEMHRELWHGNRIGWERSHYRPCMVIKNLPGHYLPIPLVATLCDVGAVMMHPDV